MRELAIAAVWLCFSAALFYIEPEMQGDYAVFVSRGKWVALILAIINALRPAVKWLSIAGMRKIGLMPPLPRVEDSEELPPRPRVVEEPDDRIQPPPPPPGAIRP